MNVLKKIPFIFIIFFVIVSQVQSEIVKRADGSQCTSQGGKCMNPKSCAGTVKSGLCPGGNDNKCCIPIEGVGSKCTYNNISGTCINTRHDKCSTTVVLNNCPGPANVKCCLSKKVTTTKNTTNNNNKNKNKNNNWFGSKCSYKNISGTCINTNVDKCSTTLVDNKCPGPVNVKCCLSKKVITTTNTTKKNTSNNSNNKVVSKKVSTSTTINKKTSNNSNIEGVGSKCSYKNISGKCINVRNEKCGTTVVLNKCPGPSNVKCCLSQKVTTTTNNNNGIGSKCTYKNIVGTCINANSDKCGTSLVKGVCPGPSNVQCCLTKKLQTTTTTTNNNKNKNTSNNSNIEGVGSKCSYKNISGKCINVRNEKCGTTVVLNKCPGPSNVKCCLSQKVTTTTNNNNGIGSKCTYKNIVGTCINANSDKCGTSLVKGACPGPSNVQCCLTKKLQTTTTTTNNTGVSVVSGTAITKFEKVTRLYLYMKYKLQNEYYKKFGKPIYFSGKQNDMFKKALDKSKSMKNGKAFVIKFTFDSSSIYGMTQAWVKEISIYQSNKNDKIYRNSIIRGRSYVTQFVDSKGNARITGGAYNSNDSISLSSVKKVNDNLSSATFFAALNEGNVSIPTEGVFHDSNLNGLSFNIDTASIGGFFLNMKRDPHGVYHAAFDCWQRLAGYIDLYDLVFDHFTEMARNKVEFTYDGKGFVLWAWKGDYINLGAGTELGLYYRNGLLNTFDLDLYAVNKNRYYMPMNVKLTFNHGVIVNYFNEKNWWMTAFNPNYLNVKASQLVSEFTVTFDIGKGSKYHSEKFNNGMFKAFCDHIESKKTGDETKWKCNKFNRTATLKF